MNGDEQIASFVATMWLVGARVLGMMLVAPVLGHTAVPLRLRVLMAVVIALAVSGGLSQPAVSGAAILPAVAVEVLLGVTIGLAVRMVFVGIELAAHHVGQQMGVSLAAAFDPFSAGGDAVRRLYVMLAVVLLLGFGGHRMIISALLRTFDAVPPGAFAPGDAMAGFIATVATAGFALALKVAAPVLLAMLLATAAMGILQRTVPQCHILSVGMPVRVMLGLVALAAAVAVVAPVMEGALDFVLREVANLTGA
ncbi:MAG: flagellar biosynthetic protein FliR [Phycisphaerae bacterium]